MSALRRIGTAIIVAVTCVVTLPTASDTYPLDAYERTGIRRLKLYKDVVEGRVSGNLNIRPGAMLDYGDIRLRMAGVNEDFDIGPGTSVDPELQAAVERIVGRRHPSYAISILDITDPAAPRYAALNPGTGYIPGSVGKLVVLTGLMNEIAQLHPNDPLARQRVLQETMVTADEWSQPSSHSVPVVNEDLTAVTHRSIRPGDTFSLWEWVDHMVSPSSNAAASTVWKQAILLDVFGERYPPTQQEEDAFFDNIDTSELQALAERVLEEPLREAGIDVDGMHLRTPFTSGARRHIPGRGSYANPLQLTRWLLKVEQGQLIDEWTSEEIKRLMYFTRRRYRYVFSSTLDEAAVYFKSGSLYSCEPEEGYECGQYRGNERNLMHSVAIIESPANPSPDQRVYLVSMMSNVLKVNSAGEHSAIGSEIEQAIRELNR